MPYNSIHQLPHGVRDNLPKHGQEIYVNAYNNAFEQYDDARDTEQRAHRVAWSAVKTSYEKHNGKWRLKKH